MEYPRQTSVILYSLIKTYYIRTSSLFQHDRCMIVKADAYGFVDLKLRLQLQAISNKLQQFTIYLKSPWNYLKNLKYRNYRLKIYKISVAKI